MAKIYLSTEIKQKLPSFALGIIETNVVVEENDPELMSEMAKISRAIKTELSQVSSHPAVSAARSAYKSCGKDPARYRLSAEALMRRAVKGLDLPHVNNVVDLVNLVSLQTGMSIGGYDAEKINGEIIMDIGEKTDIYHAIGRGVFNVENLPVLRDRISAFGSPTSDSERTSVDINTRKFLMVIFGFSGEEDSRKTVNLSVDLLIKHAKATEINTNIF
jgi:DNA/RNA-binding domain of Phe-tRNA-synthetase-like protein